MCVSSIWETNPSVTIYFVYKKSFLLTILARLIQFSVYLKMYGPLARPIQEAYSTKWVDRYLSARSSPFIGRFAVNWTDYCGMGFINKNISRT